MASAAKIKRGGEGGERRLDLQEAGAHDQDRQDHHREREPGQPRRPRRQLRHRHVEQRASRHGLSSARHFSSSPRAAAEAALAEGIEAGRGGSNNAAFRNCFQSGNLPQRVLNAASISVAPARTLTRRSRWRRVRRFAYFWRDLRLVYVLLVWAAFATALFVYFDSGVTFHGTAARPRRRRRAGGRATTRSIPARSSSCRAPATTAGR